MFYYSWKAIFRIFKDQKQIKNKFIYLLRHYLMRNAVSSNILYQFKNYHLTLKIDETQELQDLLRQKERDVEKTEDLLNSFQYEVQLLNQERNRLIGLQNNLEMELHTSAKAHKQLEEQKSENEKLKEIIDTLKTDLDEALHHQSSSSNSGEILSCELDEDTIATDPHPSIKRQPSIVSVSSSLNEESHASLKVFIQTHASFVLHQLYNII